MHALRRARLQKFAPVVLAIAGISAGAVCAHADVVVTVETRDLAADPPKVETQTIYLAPDKLAADGTDASGAKISMVFRGDRDLLWSIDHGTKAYVELDRATLQKLGGQLDAAMKQMQEQMAQLPEEQRKVVEQMMQNKLGAKKPPVLAIEKTTEQQTIDGKPCTRHDVTLDGVKSAEVWAATWKDAHVRKESFDALRGMADFLTAIMEASPALASAVGSEGGLFRGMDRIDGYPVLIRHYEDGKVKEETRFKSAEEKAVEASRYEVPAGYTKQSLGE